MMTSFLTQTILMPTGLATIPVALLSRYMHITLYVLLLSFACDTVKYVLLCLLTVIESSFCSFCLFVVCPFQGYSRKLNNFLQACKQLEAQHNGFPENSSSSVSLRKCASNLMDGPKPLLSVHYIPSSSLSLSSLLSHFMDMVFAYCKRNVLSYLSEHAVGVTQHHDAIT